MKAFVGRWVRRTGAALLLIAAGTLGAMPGDGRGRESPYQFGLDDLTVPSARAQGQCNGHYCTGYGGYCWPNPESHCQARPEPQSCISMPCD